MRTSIRFSRLLFLFFSFSCLTGKAKTVETVYVDGSFLFYSHFTGTSNTVSAVYSSDLQNNQVQVKYRIQPSFPIFLSRADLLQHRVPFGWTLAGHSLRFVILDTASDSLGRISLASLYVEDALRPNQEGQIQRGSAVSSVLPVFKVKRKQISGCSSVPFSNRRLKNPDNRILWYSLDGTNFLARLPQSPQWENRVLHLWSPENESGIFVWIEYLISEPENPKCSLSPLHANLISPDGFDPVGAVRIAGKAVRTDAAESLFPKDADWLIWEKNTNGVTRLCQMKGGRWSPVREVPRAPQTIVVDNDTETVHLLYDFAIDRADIDGSLRRLASLLKAPQPAP